MISSPDRPGNSTTTNPDIPEQFPIPLNARIARQYRQTMPEVSPRPETFSLLYGLSGLGGLMLSGCIFLPWVAIKLPFQSIEATMTGTGDWITTLPGFLNQLAETLLHFREGVAALILGILIVVGAGAGLLFNRGGAAIVTASFLGGCFMLYQLVSLPSRFTLGIPIATVQLGVYAGLGGAGLSLIAGIIAWLAEEKSR